MADSNQKSDGDQKRSRYNASELARDGAKQDRNGRDHDGDREAQPGRRESDNAMKDDVSERDSDQADGADSETETGDHGRRDQN